MTTARRQDIATLHAGTTPALSNDMEQIIFIGECRSPTARKKGWVWKDGRLAAKPLFEALRAMGVDPARQVFVNLWNDPRPRARPTLCTGIVIGLRASRAPKVALGSRVSRQLTKLKIKHVALVHPAARGLIRKRERYHAHVKERLTPIKVSP